MSLLLYKTEVIKARRQDPARRRGTALGEPNPCGNIGERCYQILSRFLDRTGQSCSRFREQRRQDTKGRYRKNSNRDH